MLKKTEQQTDKPKMTPKTIWSSGIKKGVKAQSQQNYSFNNNCNMQHHMKLNSVSKMKSQNIFNYSI